MMKFSLCPLLQKSKSKLSSEMIDAQHLKNKEMRQEMLRVCGIAVLAKYKIKLSGQVLEVFKTTMEFFLW